MRFHMVNIEQNTNCSYDELYIVDGSGMSYSICGYQRPSDIYAWDSLTIRFKTDGSVTERGFFLSYFTH